MPNQESAEHQVSVPNDLSVAEKRCPRFDRGDVVKHDRLGQGDSIVLRRVKLIARYVIQVLFPKVSNPISAASCAHFATEKDIVVVRGQVVLGRQASNPTMERNVQYILFRL